MTEAEELEYLRLKKRKAAAKADSGEATPAAPGPARAGIIGATQGLTSDFGDEIGGGIGQHWLGDGVKLGKGAEPAPDDSPMLRELKQRTKARQDAAPSSYEIYRDTLRKEADAAREAHPEAYLPAELGGAVTQMAAPGLRLAKGATVAPAVAKFGALGAASGLGSSEGRVNRGDLGRAALDMAIGGGVGALAGAGGYGLQKVLGYFGGKLMNKGADRVAKGATKAQEMADEAAAAETATARSAAGRAAQDAYRQLENLRDLKALRQLTPEETAVYEALSAELAAKSQANLIPAAAEKAATGGLYSQAVATEGERAAAKAAELSKSTAGKDTRSYFKGYGEPILGMAVGSYLGDKADDAFDLGGYGKAVGSGIGSMAFSRTRATKALVDRLKKPGNQIAIGRGMTRLGEYFDRPGPVTWAGPRAGRTGSAVRTVNPLPGVPALAASDEKPRGMAGVYLEMINADPTALGRFGPMITREKTTDGQLAMTEALLRTEPEFERLFDGLKQRLLTQRSGDQDAP